MEAVKILFDALKQRGYTRSFLRDSLKTFQVSKQKTNRELIPLITNFSTISARLNHRFKENYQSMIKSQGLLKNIK